MYLLLVLLLNGSAHATDLNTALDAARIERAAAEVAVQSLLFTESMFRPVSQTQTRDGVTVANK